MVKRLFRMHYRKRIKGCDSEIHPEPRLIHPGDCCADHLVFLADLYKFFEQIECPKDIQESVRILVRDHDFHVNPPSKKSVRRLLIRLGDVPIKYSLLLMQADLFGRPPKPDKSYDILHPIVKLFNEVKEDLKTEDLRPANLITGDDLINIGCKQGPNIGIILKIAFDAQLDGVFNTREEALSWLSQKADFFKHFEV